jgi:hypothetical protein
VTNEEFQEALQLAADDIKAVLLRFEVTTGRVVEQVDIDCDGSEKFVVKLLLGG